MMQRTKLMKRRTVLGLTHEEVAKKSNISRSYYTNIEAGRKDPSLKVMKRIADVLYSKVDDIFFNDEVPKGNGKYTA